MSMDITAAAGASAMHAMSGASYGAPPQQKMTNLFNSIDAAGSGNIAQAQFAQAFQSKNPPAVFQQQGPAAIFAALDPKGTGSVTKSDFVSGMTQLMASLRAPPAAQPSAPATEGLAASLQALNQLGSSPPSSGASPGSVVNVSA